MADVTYWFDRKGTRLDEAQGIVANGWPDKVIEGLAGKISPGQ